jgi:hypothetical protein
MNGRLNALRGREFETPPGNGRYLRKRDFRIWSTFDVERT